jgi:hypothetical protein
MKINIQRTMLVALAIAATGCGLTDPGLDETGTVRFFEIEGGCWVIDATDTDTGATVRLEPTNLPEQLRVDGLKVRFEAHPRPDLASICMVGQIVELTGIEAVDG